MNRMRSLDSHLTTEVSWDTPVQIINAMFTDGLQVPHSSRHNHYSVCGFRHVKQQLKEQTRSDKYTRAEISCAVVLHNYLTM